MMAKLSLFRIFIVLFSGVFATYVYADNSVSQGLFNYHLEFAKSGASESMYAVGNMYERGRGVKRDLHMALEWYEKAANRGNDAAVPKIKKITALIKAGKDKSRKKRNKANSQSRKTIVRPTAKPTKTPTTKPASVKLAGPAQEQSPAPVQKKTTETIAPAIEKLAERIQAEQPQVPVAEEPEDPPSAFVDATAEQLRQQQLRKIKVKQDHKRLEQELARLRQQQLQSVKQQQNKDTANSPSKSSSNIQAQADLVDKEQEPPRQVVVIKNKANAENN